MNTASQPASPLRWFLPRIPFKDLAAFSGNLAVCLHAGLTVPDSLETSTRSSPSLLLRSAGAAAADRARSGQSLSEALGGLADHLPRFYLAVLHCGEESGRTDEALRYLQEHCALLERPTQAMRNMWLVPLAIFATGSAICMIAYFAFASFFVALRFALRTIANYAVLAATVALVLNVPQLRRLWEHLLLALPAVGRASRELAVNRFFHSFNLLYCTGGMGMAAMVRTATAAVDNGLLREELLATIPKLERGDSLTESLATCALLTIDQKATIAAGEEAGKLEEAIARLCRQTSESLQGRLEVFQTVYFRILALAVTLSVAMTLYGLIAAYRG